MYIKNVRFVGNLGVYAVILLFLALFSNHVVAQSKWMIDKAHSSVKFNVTHLVISEVDGSFKDFNGSFESNNPDFTDAKIDFTVDVNSIDTDNSKRDNHLKSDDFFNAEKYPQMIFNSSYFKKKSDKKYVLTGDLTIRNATKKVNFDVDFGGTANDGYGNIKAGFKATTVINRFDYGLKWNVITEAGGLTVGEDVTIVLNVQFAKQEMAGK